MRFMVDFDSYFETLINRLNKSFDLQQNVNFEQSHYKLKAVMNIRNEKFVLSPDIKLYGFENNEIFFIKKVSRLSAQEIHKELSFLKSRIREITIPGKDHMSTHISPVFISEAPLPTESIKVIKRYFYQKGFFLGFNGWADLTPIAVSLVENKVYSNRKIQKTAAFFHPDNPTV